MNQKLVIIALSLLFYNCGGEIKKNVPYYINDKRALVDIVNLQEVDKKELSILIDKSDYKLMMLSSGKVVKEYPVVFGSNPIDDKLMEGDRCTPEGGFKVRDLYPHKSWTKFIWIDYPTADSWKKHKKAKVEDRIPEAATIGGEIGIHGVPKNRADLIHQRQNWTWGCVSLTNEDINELYPFVFKGMEIEIRQ